MVDLEPCPFCGGEPEFSVGKTGDDKDWHYIECGECEAMGPHVKYADHNIAIKDALAEAWNRRAIRAADARAEALKEAAAMADAFADQSIVDAALWRKEGMPKTAVISEEHAKAARLVAAAIQRALDDQREGGGGNDLA
ncbi:Restriction alleviation protein, Lar [uncultured Caudovirales phage]|uniref:Restriction alleviation protein, Lar n=1 Tax=uncultured Caudovirales phage TaxID=2100421 RepID=A0A6J5NDZ8_9CAUD|nr:Restriction alleviation protein, Lar [uncultured Caudovirales phage]